jgi:hypothetical protein
MVYHVEIIVDVRIVKIGKIISLDLISKETKLSRVIVKSQNVQRNIASVILTIKHVEKLAIAFNARTVEQDHTLL